MGKERLGIAADHAGFALKEIIKTNFPDIDWQDFGTNSKDSVDYPLFAEAVCKRIQAVQFKKAVLICGSGIGMSIAANKFAQIRAAHVESIQTARLAAEHNNANILCLGERITPAPQAIEMVRAWLGTTWGQGDPQLQSRHQRRISQITAFEES